MLKHFWNVLKIHKHFNTAPNSKTSKASLYMHLENLFGFLYKDVLDQIYTAWANKSKTRP